MKNKTIKANLFVIFSFAFFLFATAFTIMPGEEIKLDENSLTSGCYVCGPLGCWDAVGDGRSDCFFDLDELNCNFSGGSACWGEWSAARPGYSYLIREGDSFAIYWSPVRI